MASNTVARAGRTKRLPTIAVLPIRADIYALVVGHVVVGRGRKASPSSDLEDCDVHQREARQVAVEGKVAKVVVEVELIIRRHTEGVHSNEHLVVEGICEVAGGVRSAGLMISEVEVDDALLGHEIIVYDDGAVTD